MALPKFRHWANDSRELEADSDKLILPAIKTSIIGKSEIDNSNI